MLLGKPFAQFVEESPISVMMRGIVEYAFEEKRLDHLFEDTAEGSTLARCIFPPWQI